MHLGYSGSGDVEVIWLLLFQLIIPIEQVATTNLTHACVIAPIVYKRFQKDKDWHLTLEKNGTKLVAEIIPELPLEVPSIGKLVKVCGIIRYDKKHKWYEIHPVLLIETRSAASRTGEADFKKKEMKQ